MPQQPTAPPATRFFGRIDRFHCECPACAGIIIGDLDPHRSRQRDILAQRITRRRQRAQAKGNPEHPYNPFSCVLTCPWCHRKYLVGLLLWPVQPGAWLGNQQPPDTKPTKRQLTELRRYADAHWPHAFKRNNDHVNVAVTSDCTCPPPDGWAPACPVHGSDFVKRSS